MSRLYRVVKGMDSNPRGVILMAPPYGSVDSYSSYVNQNPENKYIKRLRVKDENTEDIRTLKDVQDEYFDDDFTFKSYK